MKKDFVIRLATPDDAQELVKIYTPYVEETAISFEYEVPAIEEFKNRISHTLERYPYIVIEQQGEIMGYAYASTFHAREAYDWDVETSIYMKRNLRGKGYGRKLYDALESLLAKQHVSNLYACIAYIDVEDEHLTNDSKYFHEHLGYQLVGMFRQCGYKFERWYDMIWMEKMIGEHTSCPEPFIPFSELDIPNNSSIY